MIQPFNKNNIPFQLKQQNRIPLLNEETGDKYITMQTIRQLDVIHGQSFLPVWSAESDSPPSSLDRLLASYLLPTK
jgi:hypothetical protein